MSAEEDFVGPPHNNIIHNTKFFRLRGIAGLSMCQPADQSSCRGSTVCKDATEGVPVEIIKRQLIHFYKVDPEYAPASLPVLD
jgi:hypothetical protein